MSKKLKKYVIDQDRDPYFRKAETSYLLTTKPGNGDDFTFVIYSFNHETQHPAWGYYETIEDVTAVMKNISGKLNSWKVI